MVDTSRSHAYRFEFVLLCGKHPHHQVPARSNLVTAVVTEDNDTIAHERAGMDNFLGLYKSPAVSGSRAQEGRTSATLQLSKPRLRTASRSASRSVVYSGVQNLQQLLGW